jgi:leader peptidase (prepilin peptidase)/N-methyltransferase
MCISLYLLFILLVTGAGICDIRTRKIYNCFPLLIALLGTLRLFAFPAETANHIVGMFIPSVPMLLLTLRLGGLGGGDIKLVAACGLFLGIRGVTLGVLFAGLLALLVMGVRTLRHSPARKEPFPFGPFLAVGFVVAMVV